MPNQINFKIVNIRKEFLENLTEIEVVNNVPS